MNRRMFLMVTTAITALRGVILPVAKAAPVEGADLLWGTYGKSGKEPLKWVKLGDCETEHLQAILRTQPQLYWDHPDMKMRLNAIKAILAARGAEITKPSIHLNLWMSKPVVMFLLFVMLAGCTSHNDPTVMSANKAILAEKGEFIGTLPDGRQISRYKIGMGSSQHDHWLYVVDGGNTVTMNHTVSNGEDSTVNHVEVFIETTRGNERC